MRLIKRVIPLIGLIFVPLIFISAHPWKPNHYIIIDTDGGFDDFRTINMLLSSPEVRVMGITTSNGVIDAKDTWYKVKCLLNDLYHEGIPVGLNLDTIAISKGCIPAKEFLWGNNYTFSDSIITAVDLINDLLDRSTDKVELVCLGSLNTAENLLKSKYFKSDRLKRILWTSKYDVESDNFNFSTDKAAFDFVRNQKIPFELITGTIDNFDIDAKYISSIEAISNSCSAKLISSFLNNNTYFTWQCFDESAALYIHYPKLFKSDTIDGIVKNRMNPSILTNNIRECFLKIISGQTIYKNQVLQYFPVDTGNYYSDINKIKDITIRKYGMEEWTSNVITCELHRHLGVYAIVGAKMGIRAREYFGIGADEMKIVSFAGTIPPFSCMNDGLQVSTGGTLGHGLITVDSDLRKEPKASFTYMGRKITLVLKNEYRQKMESEIKEISGIYGLDSNVYWELVRIAALNYWANWDRHQIFEIIEN